MVYDQIEMCLKDSTGVDYSLIGTLCPQQPVVGKLLYTWEYKGPTTKKGSSLIFNGFGRAREDYAKRCLVSVLGLGEVGTLTIKKREVQQVGGRI